MSVPQVLLVVVIFWLVTVAVAQLVIIPILRRGPGGNATYGLMWLALRIYCRLWHRARYSGLEHLPRGEADHNGLIVVSNHTGAVDPLLIQIPCRFLIRWMMASEMMIPELDWLWRQQRMIPVDREGHDAAALREAIRHVRAGGCLGIFPEGRIVTPPREVRPFFTGVGVLIARTRVPVLLVLVSGTPDTNSMSEALIRRSRARVRFIEVIDFGDEKDPEIITAHLRHRIADVSGWPLNDDMIPKGGPQAPEDL